MREGARVGEVEVHRELAVLVGVQLHREGPVVARLAQGNGALWDLHEQLRLLHVWRHVGDHHVGRVALVRQQLGHLLGVFGGGLAGLAQPHRHDQVVLQLHSRLSQLLGEHEHPRGCFDFPAPAFLGLEPVVSALPGQIQEGEHGRQLGEGVGGQHEVLREEALEAVALGCVLGHVSPEERVGAARAHVAETFHSEVVGLRVLFHFFSFFVFRPLKARGHSISKQIRRGATLHLLFHHWSSTSSRRSNVAHHGSVAHEVSFGPHCHLHLAS